MHKDRSVLLIQSIVYNGMHEVCTRALARLGFEEVVHLFPTPIAVAAVRI